MPRSYRATELEDIPRKRPPSVRSDCKGFYTRPEVMGWRGWRTADGERATTGTDWTRRTAWSELEIFDGLTSIWCERQSVTIVV